NVGVGGVPVDFDRGAAGVGLVVGLVLDGGAGGQANAFAGDRAVHWGRDNARQCVRRGPVDGHVAVVPAGRIRRCRRGAAERWGGFVDVDAAVADAGSVAGGVGDGAADALVGAFAQRLCSWTDIDSGWRNTRRRGWVIAGETEDHVGVVPAVRVGRAVASNADRRRGFVGADGRRVGRAVAGVVECHAGHRLVLAFGRYQLVGSAARDAGQAVGAEEMYRHVGVVPAVAVGGGRLGVADGRRSRVDL